MGQLDDMLKYLDRVEDAINTSVVVAAERFSQVLIDYVSKYQLKSKGEDGDKKRLGTYTNPYKRIRVSKGLQVDYVDINFSGKLHSTISVKVVKDGFRMISDVPYDKYVFGKYGLDSLKVSDENLRDFSENYVIPTIKEIVR